MPAVLVDASALVALLDRDDRSHAACIRALRDRRDPLTTVLPALTEAIQLLDDLPRGQEALLETIGDAALGLSHIDEQDVPPIKALMRKYRDTPMDFADGALVRIAERDGLTRILSFDAHFRMYALPRRGRFTVLPAPRT